MHIPPWLWFSCEIGPLGDPIFCKELAGNVNVTSYTHANPDDDTNYYWVTVCTDRGCSEIDSGNPATFADSATKINHASRSKYTDCDSERGNADRLVLESAFW